MPLPERMAVFTPITSRLRAPGEGMLGIRGHGAMRLWWGTAPRDFLDVGSRRKIATHVQIDQRPGPPAQRETGRGTPGLLHCPEVRPPKTAGPSFLFGFPSKPPTCILKDPTPKVSFAVPGLALAVQQRPATVAGVNAGVCLDHAASFCMETEPPENGGRKAPSQRKEANMEQSVWGLTLIQATLPLPCAKKSVVQESPFLGLSQHREPPKMDGALLVSL